MEIIRHLGKDLMDTAPSETVVGNMTRRVLKIIRDEYATALKSGKSQHSQEPQQQQDTDLQESLQKILLADEVDCDYSQNLPSLIQAIMEHIGEFLAELETRCVPRK